MNKISIAVGIVLVLVGVMWFTNASRIPAANPLATEVTVYKTSTCGCCKVFSKYLQAEGVAVKEVDVLDLDEIKAEHGVPMELSSCHTTIVEDYFVEGHIPLEVIEKLVSEKPDIQGIALPDMPSGTPGMPGPKYEDWVIYSVGHNGEIAEYTII